MKNFRRFAPSEALFCPILCKKLKIFGTSRHLRLYFAQLFVKKWKIFKYVMKIFNGTGVKKQGRNCHILVPGGGKIGTFGQRYLPLTCRKLGHFLPTYFLPLRYPNFASLRSSSSTEIVGCTTEMDLRVMTMIRTLGMTREHKHHTFRAYADDNNEDGEREG